MNKNYIIKLIMNLDSIDTVEQLCKVCNFYKEDVNADVVFGSFIIDACSILGVMSLLFHDVEVCIQKADKNVVDEFIYSLKCLGAKEDNN